MNAPQRLPTLPLPACLLRTPRRKPSASGHEPDVRTPDTPARPAPIRLAVTLTLLAIVLASVLLWSTPTHAQTVSTLISNTGQTTRSTATALNASTTHYAQPFTTGTNAAGYTIASIAFNFDTIGSTGTASGHLRVTLTSGANFTPATPLCTFQNPGTFTSSGVHTFNAPTANDALCPDLTSSTTYFAVIERVTNTTDVISLTTTFDTAEDAGGATGWSIPNARHSYNNSWTQHNSDYHQTEIKGSSNTGTTNHPPTGAPVVTGTPRVHETLTANTDTISDDNGTASASFGFSYKWFRLQGINETEIADATQAAYVATEADVGFKILTKVTFTDDDGYSAILASEPTDTILPALLVSNTLPTSTNGLLLTATFTKGAQAFTTGTKNAGYNLDSIGFKFHNISDTSSAGTDLQMTLNADNSGEPGNVLCTLDDPASFTSAGVQTFDVPTTGTLCPTLTKETTYFVVLERVSITSSSTISQGAITSNDEDAGSAAGWSIADSRQFFRNSLWLEGTLNHQIEIKGYPATQATGKPAISGNPRENQTLTADTSAITDPDGITNVSYNYQWVRVTGTIETDITGATNSTHTLTQADTHSKIKVKVQFTDDLGNLEGPLESVPTDTIAPDALVSNTLPTSTNGLLLTATFTKGAQAFTTGTKNAGYNLDSIGFKFHNISDTSSAGTDLQMTLNADNSGEPGNVLCTLDDPASFTSAGVQTFDVPTTGTLCPTLTKETTYFVVLERVSITSSSTISQGAITSNDEDAGSAAGWSIADSRQFFRNSLWLEGTLNHQIEIKEDKDTTAPTLSSAATYAIDGTGTGIALTFSKDLHSTATLPAPTVFTVMFGGPNRTVTSISRDPSNNDTINLVLSANPKAGEAIKLSYGKPSTNPLKDAADNEVASFTDEAVTNNNSAPGKPTLTVTPKDASLEVTAAFTDHGTHNITKYQYQAKAGTGSFGAWTDSTEDVSNTGGTFTIGGLTNGTEHTVKVRGVSGAGNGAESDEAMGTPQAPPKVTEVEITSDPGTDKTYAIGEDIVVTFTFDKNITLTVDNSPGSDPYIELTIGTVDVEVACEVGTAPTTDLVCTHRVAQGDTDNTGIQLPSGFINTPRKKIIGPLEQQAISTHSGIAEDSDHKVDGIRPTLSTANADPNDLTKIILTFNEAISAVDDTKFTIKKGAMSTTQTTNGVAIDANDAKQVIVTLTTTLVSTDTNITIDLAADAVKDIPTNGNAQDLARSVSIADTEPSAPTNLTATPAPDATPQLAVDLSWTAGHDGGSAITSHQYRYNRNSGSFGSWTTIESSAAGETNDTSFTVTGLSAIDNLATTFTFEVRAINDIGNGTESVEADTFITTPSNLTNVAVAVGDRQLEFTWDAPANGGSKILRYTYGVNTSFENTEIVPPHTTIPSSDAETTSLTVTGLTNGVAYDVRINAVNSVGPGPFNIAQAEVPATFPTAPRNLRAEAGDQQVTLRWTAPSSNGGNAIEEYQYQQKTGNGDFGSWTPITGSNANTTEHIVTGLTNGTTYAFKVRAKNPRGEGPASNAVTAVPRTVPSAPQSFAAAAGNGRVQLDWTAPASDGGFPITHYEFRFRPASSSFTEWTRVPGSNVNTTTYTVPGLTNGTLHTFELRAATASTLGTAASATATPMAGPPGQPTVTVESRHTALYVSWTVADDGGSTVTEYQVQWKSNSELFNSSREATGITGLSHTITGLENGTIYEIQVRAMNSAGWGPWSNPVSGTPTEGPGLTVRPRTLSIQEGQSNTYSVVLNAQPTSTVHIVPAASGDVTFKPGNLRFTPSNWTTWQRVRVTATSDNDATDDRLTIHHNILNTSAAEYASLADIYAVQVTITDDEVTPPSPRWFSAADESQNAIALTWHSERGAGLYEAEYREQGHTTGWTRITRGDFDHLPSTSDNRSLSAIATGLHCETTYDFRIRMQGSGDVLTDIFGPYAETSHATGQCPQPDIPTNRIYTVAPDCATLSWAAPTQGDYTGVRIRRLTLGEARWRLIHESLNSKPTSYQDCKNSGDGYGSGNNPWYAYRVTYVKFDSGQIVETTSVNSGTQQYAPPFQDHLRATPRNVRLTHDTDSQRTMTWDTPPSWTLTMQAGLKGDTVPVTDPWINGYVVERREFMTRADGYFYFSDEEEELIWSATMTVGASSSDTTRGYKGSSGTYGSLSQDDEFDHFSGRYRVYEISYGLGRLQLTLAVPPTHATDDWDLVIDGTRFSLVTGTISDSNVGALALISWTASGISWANGQEVSVQLVERDRYAWKTVRPGGDGNTSTSYTDNERANGRKFVYRIRTTNQNGASTTHSIFDWLWDSPYRDAVILLAGTDTSTDDHGAGNTGDTGQQNPPANSEPTGKPTISGTPQVGQTLTASTSGITDQDGLTNAAFSYRWIAGGSDISGATGSTYTLTSSEQGQTVQVRVTFTDAAANQETLTSAATVAVAAPAPLTASLPNSRFQSARHQGTDDRPQVIVAFSLPVASFEKTTPSVSLTGATLSSVRRHQEDGLENAWIFFLDPDADGDILFSLLTGQPCDSGGICTEDRGTLSGGMQVPLPGPEEQEEPDDSNSPATGAPAIGGTPQVDQTLTANTSAIQDADGLQNVSYQYQWLAAGSAISGATGTSYLLTSTEQGKTIQVRVTFTDDADNEESLTSEATVAAAAPAPLTAAFQDLPSSHDGSATFTFQVLFSEDVGISYVNMRDDAFTVTSGDVETAKRVDGRNDLWEITAEPGGDSDVGITLPANRSCATTGAICTREDSPRQLTNSPTATVTGPAEAPPTNNAAAGAPTISGTPQVEQTLTADTSSITDEDGLTNVSYSYQWIAGGSDIAGATGSTYTLTSSEQGQTVQVRVTFTDDADNEETLTSEATVAVAAAPNREATGAPSIGGTPQVDQTLTADTSPIDDEDGLTNVSYAYQWLAGGSAISGATGSTYTLTASEQGKTIQVKVTFTDDRNNSESLTSVATDAVAAKPAPLTVSLKTAAPASHDGSSEFTFEIEFSEEFGLGYATLKNHAFNVTGGSVERAQRTDKPSNIPWRITVKPHGAGDVTIELPATTDCDAQGAICTGDGRKLSNSLNFTVSGPGQ